MDWADATATVTVSDSVDGGLFEIRSRCNAGAIRQCDCDVLVDDEVVTSEDAACTAENGPASRLFKLRSL